MKTLLLLFCLAFTGCLSQVTRCPSKEDIKPCSCNIGLDKMPSITCDGLSSSDELRKAVKKMKGFKFSQFNLGKSNAGILPSDLFSDVEITTVSITYTKLDGLSESLNRPPFLGLETSLENLKITDAFINESAPLMRLSLSHLKKLTTLQLAGNILPTIGNDWFESGPYRLRLLELIETGTNKLGSHVFVALSELKKLRLSGGHISEIQRDMLPDPALSLESIDFSNNRISSLPDNIFSKMPSLQNVYLENNDLTSISQMAFSQSWNQLDIVYFYGNPLNCDKDIKWIYSYRLPENFQGNCATPLILKGRSLSNLTLAELQ